jgi:hypothetical protein
VESSSSKNDIKITGASRLCFLYFAFLLKEAKYLSAKKTSLVSRQINVEITKSRIKKYSLLWTNDPSCRLIFLDEKKVARVECDSF